ncbi:MAG: thioredoxin-dependent peroxiredoxin [Methanolobus sp.]|nr:thioredoxin-dependent peroxiredoxin [Methanolobus sp.]
MTNTTITEGQPTPSFCLPDHTGKTVCLEDFRGKWLVLYFYPRDNTSGCTREAQDFTALKNDFEAEGARILGVSKDSMKSHIRFMEKKELGITLLSDESTEVHQLYGGMENEEELRQRVYGYCEEYFFDRSEGGCGEGVG